MNVYVYSLISHRVQQTSQFTPLVLELSLVRSHLLWGEFSAFSAAIAIHNSPLFVPPGTHHCWVDRGGMIWKACPTPLHMADSVTRAPAVTHPSTNRAQRCLTSVIWRELVTTRPCATTWPCNEHLTFACVLSGGNVLINVGYREVSLRLGAVAANVIAGTPYFPDSVAKGTDRLLSASPI